MLRYNRHAEQFHFGFFVSLRRSDSIDFHRSFLRVISSRISHRTFFLHFLSIQRLSTDRTEKAERFGIFETQNDGKDAERAKNIII